VHLTEPMQLSEAGRRAWAGDRAKPGILLVANFSNTTGYAWNNIYSLFGAVASEFKSRGYVVWVSFQQIASQVQPAQLSQADGFLELPPSPRSPSDLRLWRQALRRLNIKILYLTDQSGSHWRFAWFRLAGVQRILVHNRISVADPRRPKPERGLKRLLKWLVARLPMMVADRVYAVSDFVRDRLVYKACFPPARVITILNGVDLERFSPGEPDRPGDTVEIFCCGRASVHKGIHVLIEAAAKLCGRSDLPPFRIRYAGDGPELESLKSQAARYGLGERFRFLGELSSTASEVRRSDIVVVPSIWGDACPSSIAEALACGKALVATRVGGVPEQVGDPPAALLVEPGDATELAEALARLMGAPQARRALAAAARAWAEAALDERRYHAEVLRQMVRDCGLREG
jgi:glycosyltransferase involved in cell wall biosynthesis